MSEEIAIRVSSVSKNFVLPHQKISSVKGLFTSAFRRSKSKETQHALKDISFEIKKGEFFGIVGRNGSGKSTLLKILAGIYQPTEGSVEVHGKLVPFIELGVGFNPELTGRENVYLNGAMLGFSQKEVEAMYDDIVEFAELERFMDQKLKNYSSGMQVRLAFSMAVRADADILLIDEVLAVGDADFQRKCFEYFKKLKKNKKTVVFVSHDMEAVREYCDVAMLVENSEITKTGLTHDVTQAYTRLFMHEQSDNSKTSHNGKRWGDQAIVVESIDVKVNQSTIIINQTIRATRTTKSPIVGFRLRDSAGKEITGTNTKIEQEHIRDLEKGQSLQLTWEMANILSEGKYIVEPAILHNDALTVADWWNDALEFNVSKPRRLPYPVDPSFKLRTGDIHD